MAWAWLALAVTREGDRLTLEISNDGPDGPPMKALRNGDRSTGIGLANTRARLEKIYGTNYQLELTPRPDGGMRVHLDLPWRPIQTLTPTP